MSDFERRLRAALHGAAEPAPPGLLAAVMRRHRRYKLRVGAGVLAVAVAVALAVPPVSAALRGTGRTPAGTGPAPATSTSTSHASRPVAAPGTVLSGCAGANSGAIGAHWRSGAAHAAGPLWFIDGGHSSGSIRSGSGSIRLYVAIAVLDGLKPGSAVVIRVAPGWQRDLRFLYGPSDTMTPQTQHLTRLAGHGELGVTFMACSPAQEIVPSRHFTDYYGGYLVRGARCVPVRAWLPGRTHSVTIRLGACPGR
jgi:hypothetical protein